MINIKKSDIGGEIISILTKGMYSDPRDALREYVQNAIDADAINISIKIRKNNIIIEDDGFGMSSEIMRKAIRIGISDKSPKEKIGFMGIGIYSSFHLCDKLDIYSKTTLNSPNRLSFNFKAMRDVLDFQKEERLNNDSDETKLIALQELLEKNISLDTLEKSDYVNNGTRVEMIGVNQDFYRSLSKFEEVSSYLEQTVPLPFNPNFKWGVTISDYINKICVKYKSVFKLINLNLQINEVSSYLYRPYKDECFEPEPLKPFFYELKNGKDFFGIAWGCLNSSRSTIKDKDLRGFIIKKHGFSIGKREHLLKYFVRQTYFNRYIGEFIVVHPRLLPNAPRNDFEFSPLRISFYESFNEAANYFNDEANKYQEYTKSDEEIDKAIDYLKEKEAQWNYYADNSERLLEILFEIRRFKNGLKGRKDRKNIVEKRIHDCDSILKRLDSFDKEITTVIEKKKKKKNNLKIKNEDDIIKDINKIPQKAKENIENEYKSLLDVIDSLGLNIHEDIKKIVQIIDEQIIQVNSENKQSYYIELKRIKNCIEESLED